MGTPKWGEASSTAELHRRKQKRIDAQKVSVIGGEIREVTANFKGEIMKAILDPVLEKYGWCLSTYPTDEFRELLNKAEIIIEPLVSETVSDTIVCYEVKEDCLDSFNTCDNQKCIKSAKAEIRKIYGKYTRVSEEWTSNDGDYERIEICSQCEQPLNNFLTWCRDDLEYIEEYYPLSCEFIKKEAFVIHSILQSSPTCDAELNNYHNYSQTKIEQQDIDIRENFFQRIVHLAESVVYASKSF